MKRGARGSGGLGGVEILVILALVAVAGGILGLRIGAEAKWERALEVRPAGASALDPGRYLSEDLTERVGAIPGVDRVARYLYVGLGQGTPHGPQLAVATELLASPMPAIGEGRILEGRGLQAEDAGRSVAVVGDLFARKQASPGSRGLTPGETVRIGNASLEIVGIFRSGVPLADQQVLVPLDTGQRLFGLAGKVSGLLVFVKSAKDRERVADALRTALGEDVDVVPAGRAAAPGPGGPAVPPAGSFEEVQGSEPD